MSRFLFFILCFYTKFVESLVCNEYHYCSVGPISSTTQTNRFKSRRPVWLESCNCDQNCYSFGDCCLDWPSLHSNPLNHWSTYTVRISSKFIYSVLIKTKCPEDWKNKKVKQKCEDIGFDDNQEFFLSESGQFLSLAKDQFLLWQVTSKFTLITYRNIYCALCNNDTKVEAWNQNVRCFDTPVGQRCSIVYYPSPPVFLIQEKVQRKPIQTQIYSKCDIGWYKTNIQINSKETIEIVKNCTRFYAPVVVQNNAMQKLTAFKNQFCAKCNGKDENQILCPSDSGNFFEHRNPFPSHFDESLTFDTNFLSDNNLENSSNTSCPRDHIFNPLDNNCRLIYIKTNTDRQMINDNNQYFQRSDDSDLFHSNTSHVLEVDELTALSKQSYRSNVILRTHKTIGFCLTFLINLVTNVLLSIKS